MIEITGVESKIEGLIQVLTESEDRILEISRTGRMVMRRGQHTSRVLDAMRVATSETEAETIPEAEAENVEEADLPQ
jgi:acetolactate synthase-1/3 small subunit